MKLPRIEYIVWEDASYDPDDTAHSDPAFGQLAVLHEIGFVIRETEKAVTIAMEYQAEEPDSSRLTLTIPKVNIVKRKQIRLRNVGKSTRESKNVQNTEK